MCRSIINGTLIAGKQFNSMVSNFSLRLFYRALKLQVDWIYVSMEPIDFSVYAKFLISTSFVLICESTVSAHYLLFTLIGIYIRHINRLLLHSSCCFFQEENCRNLYHINFWMEVLCTDYSRLYLRCIKFRLLFNTSMSSEVRSIDHDIYTFVESELLLLKSSSSIRSIYYHCEVNLIFNWLIP